MPTYEYECTRCGHVFEKFQSITSEPLKRCPKCRCRIRRLFGAGAGLLFKGSGFYQTDYRSADYTRAVQAEKKAVEPAAATKSDKKSETKPATAVASASTSSQADS